MTRLNLKSLKRICTVFLCSSLILLCGCSKTEKTTVQNSVSKVTTYNTLEVVNIYEAIKEVYPKTSLEILDGVNEYHWWNNRHRINVDGTKITVDEYENYDDAKMYVELINQYNNLDEYFIKTMGVSKEYLNQEKIDIDEYRSKFYQKGNLIITFPNDITTRMESEIVTVLEDLKNIKMEQTYSSNDYLQLLNTRKESFNKVMYSPIEELFKEKDEKNTNYINDTLSKYQDTTVGDENYLTLKKEVEGIQEDIQLVSSTSRYSESYQPLITRLTDLDTQCNDVINNKANDLESKIQSLEGGMNYDLLAEVGALYGAYASEEAYADKIDDWKTRIDTLNTKAEEQKKQEEEAAKQAEAERIAQEQAAAEAEKAKQEQAAQAVVETYDYILNTNTKVFHWPSCHSVNRMKDKNKKSYNGTRDDLLSKGYKSCGNCNP